VSGAVLLGITAFLFWMRFRRRQTSRTKGLTLTSNTALALLSVVALLYTYGAFSKPAGFEIDATLPGKGHR